jgi:succinate dehydrogenase/fumarate reductase cytochrome b subunit
MSAVAAPPSTQPLHNAARQCVAAYGRRILAASGFMMLGFVLLHLAGNLVALGGSAKFNAYARSLRELGAPLVGQGTLLLVARVVLGAVLTIHLLAHLLIQWQPSDGGDGVHRSRRGRRSPPPAWLLDREGLPRSDPAPN